MYKQNYDIKILCEIIKLSRSVYYYRKNNKTNKYLESNKNLDEKILEVYNKSKKKYGSPKIAVILNNNGFKVSQKRVARRI